MFGQITELPHLRTWQEAFDHYSSITPLRGTDIRPICATRTGRRKKQYHIAHRSGSNDIACVLYDTDVLLFHPDGEITFTNGDYITNTTHSFATGILGGCSGQWGQDAVVFFTERGQTTVQINGGEKLALDRDQPVKLRWKEKRDYLPTDDWEGGYEFINKPPMYSYFVNRKKLNEHRKKVSEFRNTCIACSKLVNPDDYVRLDITQMYASRKPAAKVYASMTGSRQKQGDLMEWLFFKATDSLWSYQSYTTSFYTDPKRVAKLIDDALKFVFFEEVFNKQEVDKPNTNNNAQYAKGKETFI